MNPDEDKIFFYVFVCSSISKIFCRFANGGAKISTGMVNGLNVALEKFSFDLKVLNRQLNQRVACVAGACPERVLLEILGEGVPPGSPNPDPVSDQKM